MVRRFFTIVALFFVLNSCFLRKSIFYTYDGGVEDSLSAAVHELQDFYKENGTKIYALVSHSIGEGTSIVLNDCSKMPKEIKKLVRSSNRYVVVGSKKIPALFYLDDESNFVKHRWAHLPYTGFLVKFHKDSVLYKGVLF